MSHIDRRRFNSILAGLGLASAGSAFGASRPEGEPEVLHLSRNGWMPNNEHLPVLLYRNVIGTSGTDPAAHFEAIFVGTAGRPSGVTACTTSTTITRLRMRCWVSSPGTPS